MLGLTRAVIADRDLFGGSAFRTFSTPEVAYNFMRHLYQ